MLSLDLPSSACSYRQTIQWHKHSRPCHQRRIALHALVSVYNQLRVYIVHLTHAHTTPHDTSHRSATAHYSGDVNSSSSSGSRKAAVKVSQQHMRENLTVTGVLVSITPRNNSSNSSSSRNTSSGHVATETIRRNIKTETASLSSASTGNEDTAKDTHRYVSTQYAVHTMVFLLLFYTA